MKKRIKATAYYCKTAKPIPANAKFHKNMYQIGAAISPEYEGALSRYLSRDRDQTIKRTDDGKAIINIYSKFPFPVYIKVEGNVLPIERVDSDYDNLVSIKNGTEFELALSTYENEFGEQLTCEGVMLYNLPESYNPFLDDEYTE